MCIRDSWNTACSFWNAYSIMMASYRTFQMLMLLKGLNDNEIIKCMNETYQVKMNPIKINKEWRSQQQYLTYTLWSIHSIWEFLYNTVLAIVNTVTCKAKVTKLTWLSMFFFIVFTLYSGYGEEWSENCSAPLYEYM